jgi:hypothetical protein
MLLIVTLDIIGIVVLVLHILIVGVIEVGEVVVFLLLLSAHGEVVV